MQRFYKFIVVLFLLTANWLAASAQHRAVRSRNPVTTLNGKKVNPSPLSQSQRSLQAPVIDGPVAQAPLRTFTSLPSDYYLKRLGFVCKAEYALEKKLNLPLALRVRAGSLDYVNKLEGKR